MPYSIIPTQQFKKEAKRLIKKYPSLREELRALGELLAQHPETGTPMGHQLFKIRLAVRSKGKGKSGGTRVITYVLLAQSTVYLLTLYDKSEFDSIDDKTLRQIISGLI